MNADTDTTAIKDDSSDKDYFTITPRLVWALARDPYDLALWMVIKDVAGEKKECILSTPELAILAMMSAGKVQTSRQFLIDMGLLEGEVRRDPGYPQPVWHLTIPNIWKQNIAWAEGHLTIRSRVEFKTEQKERSPGESLERSPHESSKERSPGEKGTSPGEKGGPPGEKGTSPGETKKNQKKNQREDPKEESARFSEIFDNPEDVLEGLKTQIKIQGQLDQTNFRRMILPLAAAEWVDHTLQIVTDNEPNKLWLSTRGIYLFKQALVGLTGRNDLAVEFKLPEEVIV